MNASKQVHDDVWFNVFVFNASATTEIYTLSLHDALPISYEQHIRNTLAAALPYVTAGRQVYVQCENEVGEDRKSTRLNSSHSSISYAVFCLKKKKFLS